MEDLLGFFAFALLIAGQFAAVIAAANTIYFDHHRPTRPVADHGRDDRAVHDDRRLAA